MYRLCSICFTYANFKELLNHMTIYCSNTRLLVLYNIFYWLKMAGLKLMSSSGVGFIHELPTVHKSLSVVVLRQNYLLYIVVSHPIETLANGTIIIFTYILIFGGPTLSTGPPPQGAQCNHTACIVTPLHGAAQSVCNAKCCAFFNLHLDVIDINSEYHYSEIHLFLFIIMM